MVGLALLDLDGVMAIIYFGLCLTFSSTIVVIGYLKTTKQASPEVQMQAEEYINLGYQRLTTFEVHNGGDWTGPDDQSTSLQVVYDEDNVYVGLIVTDEYHELAKRAR